MKTIRWGIIGLGNIAHKFAADLALVANCKLQAVASSDETRAQQFVLYGSTLLPVQKQG